MPGDSYLRLLLVHGARSVLCHAKKATSHDRLRTWALALQKRSRHNKAAVALANKLARIVWAVWKNGRAYESIARRLRRDRPPWTARGSK
jgi:transposase